MTGGKGSPARRFWIFSADDKTWLAVDFADRFLQHLNAVLDFLRLIFIAFQALRHFVSPLLHQALSLAVDLIAVSLDDGLNSISKSGETNFSTFEPLCLELDEFTIRVTSCFRPAFHAGTGGLQSACQIGDRSR